MTTEMPHAEIKSKIFIASSLEGKVLAQKIERALRRPDTSITVWWRNFFSFGAGTLESLINQIDEYDFAVVVLSADHKTIRSASSIPESIPRSNVTFEAGMLMSRLGRDRTLLVWDIDEEIAILSDLAGITAAPFRSAFPATFRASMRAIRETVEKLSIRSDRLIGRVPYRHIALSDIFGVGIVEPNGLSIAFGQLDWREDVDQVLRSSNLAAPTFPLRKRGATSFLRTTNPVSLSEMRSAGYLTAALGSSRLPPPRITSDVVASIQLDKSFVALGSKESNLCTERVFRSQIPPLAKAGDDFMEIRGKQYRIQGEYDIGVLIKVVPPSHPTEVWLACAGLGEWGTSGCAWYLANRWKRLHRSVGDKPFAAIIRTPAGHDELADLEDLVSPP